jgi:hypothetical protein
LRLLRVFGSRVCVKRTGKRRSKLDKHAFNGIFLGYTATDENIRYIDVNTRIVKTSHHAIFDEAWYLQPKRPPFAQMLFDVGLEPDFTVIPTLPSLLLSHHLLLIHHRHCHPSLPNSFSHCVCQLLRTSSPLVWHLLLAKHRPLTFRLLIYPLDDLSTT